MPIQRPDAALRRAVVAVLGAIVVTAGLLATPAHADVDRVYTYEVSRRGDTSTSLESFADHVGRTLDDRRGWSLGGAIDFRPVAEGGDFHVILASPAAIDRAAPECSRRWSCRVGDDVLINEQRWNDGTARYDRPLHDYRHYVVNHEVGHWLGLGHVDCPGEGEAAPVMMQQSKGLDGCTSTVWPLEWEQERVGERHGADPHPVGLGDLLWYETWNDAGVSVGRSTGGDFAFAGQWIQGWGMPDWAAAGDVDDDGFADLLWYEEWNNGGVTIGTSDGENRFAFSGQWATGLAPPEFAAAGDVNGDGASDLVWYRTAGGGVTDVYLSTGSTFSPSGRWMSGWGAPTWAALGDVNGDGLADLVWYEEWNDGGITVGLSDGSGSFRWSGQWHSGLRPPTFAALGDVDADGDDDLVWYRTDDRGTVDVYASTGSSLASAGTWVRGWGGPTWAGLGDLDLDGDADLAWYEAWNDAGVTVGLSNRSGSFTNAGQWITGWGTPDLAFLADAG